MQVDIAWDNLYQAIKALEQRQGDWDVMAATAQAALFILFEYSAEEILPQVEASDLPTRATVSWLVYEGGKMKDLDQEKVAALAALWKQGSGQDLLAPPPGPGAEPMKVH